METVEVMGDPLPSAHHVAVRAFLPVHVCPCPPAVSRARPAQQLRTKADRERGATNRPHSRAACFYGSRNAGWFGTGSWRSQSPFFSSLPGYRGDFQGDPTLSPSQERDFSLQRKSHSVHGSAPAPYPLTPLSPPRPATQPQAGECSLEPFKTGNHTKLCLMAF